MKIKELIVCDDIRQEIGNKITLVGIYSDKINIQLLPGAEIKWPIAMRLGTFVRFEDEQVDKDIDMIELEYSIGNKTVLNAGGPLVKPIDSSISSFITVIQYFPITQQGDLNITVKFRTGTDVKQTFPNFSTIHFSVQNLHAN